MDSCPFLTIHIAGILQLVDQIVKSALEWQPNFNSEIFLNKLTIFYEKYNPDKIDTVDALALKHRGHEDDLIVKLEKRYKANFHAVMEEEEEL